MRVEGVSYRINWEAFQRGMSIFIPCLDTPRARQVVHETTRRLKLKVLIKVAVEDGIKGLRIWRV